MTWWNETGTHWWSASCLLAVVMLLAFWGAVFVALTALFGTTRSQPRRDAEAPRDPSAARPAETAALGVVTTTAPARHS
jgi:hypothetical protein